MADLSTITLPNNTTYNLKDSRVPANAVFTDTKVTQTASTSNAHHEVLFSATADNTTRTEGSVKSNKFTANPNTGEFYAEGYKRIEITGQTVNINDYNLSSGTDNIKAASAITSGNIIVGDESGYFNLTSGSVFDITYPILYANSAIAASGTGANNYFCISFAVSNMQSLTLTAYKAVFIKGTLSGTDFIPVSTAPLTQTVPTTADHYQYLLLGIANSSTMMYLTFEHPIFEYTGRAFREIGSLSNYPWETDVAQIGWNKEIHSSLTSGTLTYNIPTPQSSIAHGAQEIRCIADLTAASNLAISIKAPTGYVLTDGDVITTGGGTLSYTGLNASIYEISIVLLNGSTLGLIMKEWPA